MEVKAGKSGGLKSLIQFIQEKPIQHAIRLDLTYRSPEDRLEKISHASLPEDRRGQVSLHNIPLFAVEYLEQFIFVM